jgi:6-phosphogluconate dehydrogenase
MGLNMVKRLHEKGHGVLAYNKSPGPREEVERFGVKAFDSISDLIKNIPDARRPTPQVVWLMVPNTVVDQMISEITPLLQKGDILIDGGNSFYKDSIRRSEKLSTKGIHFLDIGVSGGPNGARNGACLMIGGDKAVYEELEKENLFKDLSVEGGYGYMGKSGSGHFVKMIHNGIEYGMMQSIAEGFAILRQSSLKLTPLELDLKEIASIYNHKSVIESRLIEWLSLAFEKYGTDLENVSGTVAHTGEGEWTVKTAKELGVSVDIIEKSFQFRVQSAENPSYEGRILSALRNQFGGHDSEARLPTGELGVGSPSARP